MRISDNTEMLEIRNDQMTIYPILTWDDTNVVLIDTGFPGQIDLFREAVGAAGFALEDITHVITTHSDVDHIGCTKLLHDMGAKVLAHEIESAYIQGEKTSPKLAKMQQNLSNLTDEQRVRIEQLIAGAPKFYVHVDQTLHDGELLPMCGGIEVIHTPGHTPGHIALLLKSSLILVAGYASVFSEGILTGPVARNTLDMESAHDSFNKMMAFNPKSIVCYHSGYLSF